MFQNFISKSTIFLLENTSLILMLAKLAYKKRRFCTYSFINIFSTVLGSVGLMEEGGEQIDLPSWNV